MFYSSISFLTRRYNFCRAAKITSRDEESCSRFPGFRFNLLPSTTCSFAQLDHQQFDKKTENLSNHGRSIQSALSPRSPQRPLIHQSQPPNSRPTDISIPPHRHRSPPRALPPRILYRRAFCSNNSINPRTLFPSFPPQTKHSRSAQEQIQHAPPSLPHSTSVRSYNARRHKTQERHKG